MKNLLRFCIIVSAACLACPQVLADEGVFATQGDVALTHQELDAAFARIPEKYRMAFIRDGSKVDQLVQSLLRYKQIARDAESAGFSEDAIITGRMALAAEKELAEAWLEQKISVAPEGDYEAMAFEYYLANPEKFQSDEMVDVSHILIKSDTRAEEKALAQVSQIYEELKTAPERFDEYVREYSEDPAVNQNNGKYMGVARGQMVKPFEDQAFAMNEPGEISEPVRTEYGYHIIRLDGKTPPDTLPFEQVKAATVEQVRLEYLTEFRKNYIISVSAEPIKINEGAIEAMAKRHFGDNLERAPDYYEDR